MMRQSPSESENQMFNIIEFTQLIDPKFVPFDKQIEDYLETLDNDQVAKFKASKLLYLQRLALLKKKSKETYLEIWKDICRERIIYRKPQNVPENWTIEHQDENLYVFADFVKPSMTIEQVFMTPEIIPQKEEGMNRDNV